MWRATEDGSFNRPGPIGFVRVSYQGIMNPPNFNNNHREGDDRGADGVKFNLGIYCTLPPSITRRYVTPNTFFSCSTVGSELNVFFFYSDDNVDVTHYIARVTLQLTLYS